MEREICDGVTVLYCDKCKMMWADIIVAKRKMIVGNKIELGKASHICDFCFDDTCIDKNKETAVKLSDVPMMWVLE